MSTAVDTEVDQDARYVEFIDALALFLWHAAEAELEGTDGEGSE